ncbi:MAG: aminotransferase class V-fold PLP-dependent enzyme, partial [Candidatus Aminicenantes bacterium]|nr:aminotransferase class V-fold PLP-dependent enzyme [Candidatus Aminicenantes bacterium]
MWNRRDFLKGCAVGVGALSSSPGEVFERIIAAGRDRAGLSAAEVAADEDFWFDVQQAFTEDRNYINLNNGTVQNGLRIVQEAVRRHTEFTGNAAWHSMAVLNKEIESCRRRLASHLGCDPEELVICRGGTEAGQIPILGIELNRGDEVVITNQDYPRLLSTWRQRAKREGIVLKIVPLPAPPVPLDVFYRLVAEAVTPRTKVILLCHITNLTGQIFPVREIARAARARGIRTIVDGAPAHTAKKVTQYVASTDGRLKLFILPPYSPELNPDEWVWKNV